MTDRLYHDPEVNPFLFGYQRRAEGDPRAKKQVEYLQKGAKMEAMKALRGLAGNLAKSCGDVGSDDVSVRIPHLVYSSLLGICNTNDVPKPCWDVTNEQFELCLEKVVPQMVDGVDSISLEKELMAKYWCHDTFFKDSVYTKTQMNLRALERNLGNYCNLESILKSDVNTKESWDYFTNKGLSLDDAKGCTLALIFFTGSGSDTSSAASSIEAMKEDQNTAVDAKRVEAEAAIAKGKTPEEKEAIKRSYEASIQHDIANLKSGLEAYTSDRYASIVYYLIKALSNIPCYWGTVERWVDLSDEFEDYALYVPGNVVTWVQFSSSAMVQGNIKHFKARNTKFVIQSARGRDISKFSLYSGEKEVLFAPFARFLVLGQRKENIDGNLVTVIYMREVEVGLSNCNTVLWVDDEMLNKDWENKALMENAQMRTDGAIRFITKTTTSLGVAFLRSCFGQRLLHAPNFRIISDMTRTNESSSDQAGAIFMKEVGRIGFKDTRKMIFTSNKQKGEQKLKDHGVPAGSVEVSVATGDAQRFIEFRD